MMYGEATSSAQNVRRFMSHNVPDFMGGGQYAIHSKRLHKIHNVLGGSRLLRFVWNTTDFREVAFSGRMVPSKQTEDGAFSFNL